MTSAAWITLAVTWTVIGVITVRLLGMVLRGVSSDSSTGSDSSNGSGSPRGIGAACEDAGGPEASSERRPFATLLASEGHGDRRFGLRAGLVSLILHAVGLGGLAWATVAVRDDEPEEQVTIVELVQDPVRLPPPPEPVRVREPEVVIPDAPRGFQTLAAPEIVPPDIPPPGFELGRPLSEEDFGGEGVEGGRAGGDPGTGGEGEGPYGAPRFIPYDIAPELLNREEVTGALTRQYPEPLRRAGIGGRVMVWVFVDERGTVRDRRIETSGGHPLLDETALKVAELMQFRPAQARDRPVGVWVAVPVQFTITE